MNRAPTMHDSSPSSEVWQSVAFALMLAMTLAWALSAIGFLFGASVGRWQATCGILLAVFMLFRRHRDGWASWLGLAGLIAAIAASLILSAATVDDTYDGWLYHQPGVIALSHGWNPIAEPIFGKWWASYSPSIGYPVNGPAVDILWTTVYPKALWILGAQAVTWGLPLDSGKYPALLLIFIVGLTALRALRLRGIRDSWAYAISAVAALNPVSVVQATSFCVDGALGSCLAILIFALCSYDAAPSGRDLVLALCAGLLACNLKFTGPIYTALILLPFAVWWLFRRRLVARDLLICGIAASVLFAASINPYLTNFRAFGSPVYPLNEWDMMEDQMAPGFLNKNRLTKLLISLTFSNLADRNSGNPAADERNFTSPLQSRGFQELKKFGSTADLRIGGFGPFFGLVIGLSLLAACSLIRGSRNELGFAAVVLGTLLSVLINPEMWWARYVPQMWLLPILVITDARKMQAAKASTLLIVVLTGVTCGIAVIGRATSSCVITRAYEDNLRRIGDAPLLVHTSYRELWFLPTVAYRLHQQGATMEVATGPCANPIGLLVIQGCKKDSDGR